jgi:hypothetical protein
VSVDPNAGDSIKINGDLFTFTEAANTQGIVYAEIGRKAKVYRLLNGERAFALKTFKPRYCSEDSVVNVAEISKYKSIPGLTVADRTVIWPDRYPDLIAENSAFEYAVLMPWIEGESWSNYVARKIPAKPSESLRLAQTFVNTVFELEQRNLAHCDLSGSNFIFSSGFANVELIDIEDMFGVGLVAPRDKPKGTEGYRPEWLIEEETWKAEVDRFSSGILVCEILGWRFEKIREASSGDAFFANGEFGNKSKRFRLMNEQLSDINPDLANLFTAVWRSESLEECPRIADWKSVLDDIQEPELTVSPNFLKFGLIDLSRRSSKLPTATIQISNTGGGILSGKISSNVPWLTIAPQEFSNSKGIVSEHQVILQSRIPFIRKQKQYSFSKGLTVISGVGNVILPVSYLLTLPKTKSVNWILISIIVAAFILILFSGLVLIALAYLFFLQYQL